MSRSEHIGTNGLPLAPGLGDVPAAPAKALGSRERLVELIRERFAGRRLVVVSNRAPVLHVRGEGGRLATLQPASGLTTAMLPIVEACGGTWVAHGGGTADFDVTDARGGLGWPPERPAFRLRRVRLAPDVERGYYYGLANEALWPLCHVAYVPPVFRHRDWAHYREANRAFADAVLDELGDGPGVVFVNDYHFALLPRMLRRARPDLLVAHFWHIPWPNRQVWGLLPWAEEFLDGLLGSDLLGFHVQGHCGHFLDTVDRALEARVEHEYHRATRGGHATFVRPFPISIDARAFTALARARPFEAAFPGVAARTDGRLVLLGVDRLDYTKGIPHRLQMFETLLERHPDFRGRATLVQVGAPTRSVLPRYAALAREVAALVAGINTRFGTPGWRPVLYLDEHHDRDALAALYRRADACLVTSLHDGMNLVAKEYVAARAGLPGTLLLSKFTGAARELLEASLINPYDVEGSAEVLAAALRLPDAARAEGMRRMLSRLERHDVYNWARRLFRSLDEVAWRREALGFPGT
ncbi:MAG TPA: trehalose-6-phosphate synthase [Polyangiaceae bacterium]|nr:trehalose-6-phosphate synthase [Polyangiaceae bacterium]